MAVWGREESAQYVKRLEHLEFLRAQTYSEMDSSTTNAPNAQELKLAIRKITEKLDYGFNPHFGSLFRSGSSESFFLYQCKRFADLYCSDLLHMLEYPLFYFFSARPQYISHERALMEERDYDVVKAEEKK